MVFPAFAVIGVCHFGGVRLFLDRRYRFYHHLDTDSQLLAGLSRRGGSQGDYAECLAGGFVGAYDGDPVPLSE